ncbi:MAG: chemotaxis-specific protein-glutamate methyltransferase CheB [Planctomycetota bacterium]|nr:chemotaxis-specific protein-glutamate methyltransferase CheB [Planctomycetota bacterium]
MRVGIVNDLKLAQFALRRLVDAADGASVAWVAEDGQQAVQMCTADTPDVVLMDLIMPNVDGVEATRLIMKTCPCPILVVTATVEGNLTKVYQALGAGALDAVNGPTFATDGTLENTEPVVRKMRAIQRLSGGTPVLEKLARRKSSAGFPSPSEPAERLVVIGASTGGPQAIVDVIRGMPADFRPPVVVVQHLDKSFVPGFVSWLAGQTGWPGVCVGEGDAPQAGVIQVAASDDHLVMAAARRMRYEPEPKDYPYRPSVDAFFLSLRRNWPTPGVGMVLTGMGQDGAKGLKALRDGGWATLAQDQATSVVWGMPRAANEQGGADCVLPVGELGAAAARHLRRLESASRTPDSGKG